MSGWSMAVRREVREFLLEVSRFQADGIDPGIALRVAELLPLIPVAEPMTPDKAMEIAERRSTPEPNTGCLLWFGAADREGYGQTHDAGRGRMVLVTRALLGIVDEAPETALALHACDQPGCVRKDHLFIGTRSTNFWDMISKGRYPTRADAVPRRVPRPQPRGTRAKRRAIFAAVMLRDGGACTAAGFLGLTCSGVPELDHQWGRGRERETLENVRVLCTRHHRLKTDCSPNRVVWLEQYRLHVECLGYGEELVKTDRALALERGQHPERMP